MKNISFMGTYIVWWLTVILRNSNAYVHNIVRNTACVHRSVWSFSNCIFSNKLHCHIWTLCWYDITWQLWCQVNYYDYFYYIISWLLIHCAVGYGLCLHQLLLLRCTPNFLQFPSISLQGTVMCNGRLSRSLRALD